MTMSPVSPSSPTCSTDFSLPAVISTPYMPYTPPGGGFSCWWGWPYRLGGTSRGDGGCLSPTWPYSGLLFSWVSGNATPATWWCFFHFWSLPLWTGCPCFAQPNPNQREYLLIVKALTPTPGRRKRLYPQKFPTQYMDALFTYDKKHPVFITKNRVFMSFVHTFWLNPSFFFSFVIPASSTNSQKSTLFL